MSFKTEMILWLRDIRHFAFKIPAKKYGRYSWIYVMIAWIAFLTVTVYVLIK